MSAQAATEVEVKNAWDGIAEGFDDLVTPLTMPLAEQGLDRVGLRPGMRLLDIAAGSGALSIPAARRGARVTGTDFAPTMVERLNERAREGGLDNLDARVMDGYALDAEDDSFDVVASQNGVSLFPDLQRGLREMVRVTKPGGRVLVIAFADLAKAEFLTFPFGAIKQAVPGFQGIPMDPPPVPFQLADPGKMRRELSEAGLRDVRVETVNWAVAFESPKHVLDVLASSNPIGTGIVAGLTREQRGAVEKTLERALRERAGGSGPATLNTAVNIGIGTK